VIATEAELQVAREAAAEVAYYRLSSGEGPVGRFRELDEATQVRFRDLVAPLVAAALEALPDRGHAARLEALAAVGLRVRTHLCTCGSAGAPSAGHEHWCPGSVVDGELE
jgi:hypothetical protein